MKQKKETPPAPVVRCKYWSGYHCKLFSGMTGFGHLTIGCVGSACDKKKIND